MKAEGEFSEGPYTCAWRRNDRFWGNAVDVWVFDGDARLGAVSFACHPEFPDFNKVQALTTDDLVAASRVRLREVINSGAALEAWEMGFQLLVTLNAEAS